MTTLSSKKPSFLFLLLIVAVITLIFSGYFAWHTYANTSNSELKRSVTPQSLDKGWYQGSKSVHLDDYIAANQVSQNIKEKKQRVMLEPELIHFDAVLQDKITRSKAELVMDALAVWDITPVPQVSSSTYVRSPENNVIGVYVEDTIAEHISTLYQPETPLEFQAYRLYNYANGPRLLIVGVKALLPLNKEVNSGQTE